MRGENSPTRRSSQLYVQLNRIAVVSAVVCSLPLNVGRPPPNAITGVTSHKIQEFKPRRNLERGRRIEGDGTAPWLPKGLKSENQLHISNASPPYFYVCCDSRPKSHPTPAAFVSNRFPVPFLPLLPSERTRFCLDHSFCRVS